MRHVRRARPTATCDPARRDRVPTRILSTMAKTPDSYAQRLPALELSIERSTDNVPHDGHYHLLRGREQLGRFKSLKAAQESWRAIVDESGWTPPRRELDSREYLVREATMRENERFQEYWGSSHKFRVRGGVHRNR
jgi:hypothetical protein